MYNDNHNDVYNSNNNDDKNQFDLSLPNFKSDGQSDKKSYC